MRSMMVAAVAAVALGVAGLISSSAEAAPSPTPNGFCGAANMLASDAMAGFFADPPYGPMVHNTTQNTNGNDGMFNAVGVSACS